MKHCLFILMCFCLVYTTQAQIAVGQTAPEIKLTDTKGKPFELSSLKGKVVLIDFWASWCAPCRASIPGVIKLFNKYKASGFEVLGVSIDVKKANWLKAIKQDGINYKQVFDAAGWNSKVAEAYKVEQIPMTFLLDKNGTIVGVDLSHEAMEEKIKELMKQ